MTHKTAANRYARALLDVAVKEADPEKAGQELADFIDLLHRHPALERPLLNPAVPAARKRAAVVELAKLAGLSPVVAKLLTLLAERDRLPLLGELTTAYRDLLLDRRQVVRAEVTTSVPLPPGRAKAIEQRLGAVTGKRVEMETKIDASIIGGIIARVGGTIYDGSIATQLKRMKERLTS